MRPFRLLISKMSVVPTADHPVIGVKNIVINTYLRQTVRKLYQNKKPSIWEYFQFYNYFLLIIKEIVCIYFFEDKRLRLYLCDVTLFIGGVRQFNRIVIILGSVMSLYMFKVLHFTTDVRLMKWIELFQVINGTKDPALVVFTKQPDHLVKIGKFAKRFYTIFGFICSTMSK